MEMRKITLGDCIIDCASGPFGSNLKVECFVEDGFPIIDGANLKGVRVTDNITKFVTEEKARSLSRSIAKRRDVIVTISGTLGQISFIPNDSKYNEYLCSQRQFRVTFDESKIDVEYLVNYLHTDFGQKKILSFANYVGVPALAQPLPNFKKIELLIPSIQNQKKVVQVLSALDDKIALNKKMNQKLEAMAKRLYDYWFVQYDFPDKNGHPYKTTGGPMTYNPTLKREIPAGWEEKTLKECIKHINTGLNPRDNFVLGNGDIKYVTVKNLTMEGNIDFSGCDFIDEDALKKVHKRSDIAKGDVLYASICPLGRSYLINKDPVGWDINESVFSIRPNLDVISSEFLSVFLKDSAVVEKASKMATGSIFKGIRIKELENMILAVPVKDVMEKFSKQIKNLIELEHKNTEQIAHLTALRDKLLPLLMNGQVVV